VSWDRLGVHSVQTAGNPTWTINPQKRIDKQANDYKSMRKTLSDFLLWLWGFRVSVFSLRECYNMPRRTVLEVTVQDVQKRRNPNKHYVSWHRLTSLNTCNELFLMFFLLMKVSRDVFCECFSGWSEQRGWRCDQEDQVTHQHNTLKELIFYMYLFISVSVAEN